MKDNKLAEMNDNYFNNIYNNLSMSSTLLSKPTLPTSHSLTSITIPTVKNKSIDPILTNLQNRKKQLMETLSKKDMKSPQQQQREDKIKKMQDKKCSISPIDENKQKKRKYEMKIEKQREECEKIKNHVQCVQNEMLRCVAEREDCEVRIKRISEEVGIQYRHAFGIEQANCQQSRKWIYHKILELQSKIESSPLNMRKLMCKIYSQEISKTDIIEDKTPAQPIFQYIVKMRLVNKLYGAILTNKIQRKQKNKSKYDKQLLQNSIRSGSSISDNYSDIDSSCLSECDEDKEELVDIENEDGIVNGDEDEDENWYETWVSILKLMKKLQKMQPILLVNNQQIDQKIKQSANIVQLKKQIKMLLQQQRRQKIKIRDKQKLIKQLKNKRIELDQDLKIKQEYIEQLKQKVKKYQTIIINSNSNKNNQNQCRNTGNRLISDEHNASNEHQELRQIDQAINYFTIKKNTYTPGTREVEKQTNDISMTTMLSPIKSTIRNEIMTSPYLNIKSTMKRSNKKYSLKDLLSPSKSYMVLDKKQAWK